MNIFDYMSKIEPIYDIAMRYSDCHTPLIVIAGKNYGTGSSRDWAAKGTNLLGVKAVIAESFERIHRSNLVGMGVLPFLFEEGQTRKSLNLTGNESFEIIGLTNLQPKHKFTLKITYQSGEIKSTSIISAINTDIELGYIKAGGIMQYVVNQLSSRKN